MDLLLRGVFTALVTPFRENGDVDEESLRRIVEFQIENGIRGLVPCGSTGESPTLSHDEHDRAIDLVVKYAKGRAAVLAGTGSNSTAEAIRLSTHAEKSGADALLVVNPYYNKPTQKGLYLHFKAVAESVHIPVVIYNIQSRTGVNVETDTMVRLMSDCPNIMGVKEASGNLGQMKDVIARRKPGFSVLSGDDNMTMDLIDAGGDGVVSVASNIAPKRMVQMVDDALNGRMASARAQEAELKELFSALFVETNPIPIKAMMAKAGFCKEVYRLPLCSLSTEQARVRLERCLSALGLGK